MGKKITTDVTPSPTFFSEEEKNLGFGTVLYYSKSIFFKKAFSMAYLLTLSFVALLNCTPILLG